MGAPASTLRAAMGEWVAGPRQVACRRSMCHGACSARTRAHAAMEGAPCRRIAWPMCSRQSLECEEATFTVAVKKAAYLCERRQTSGSEWQVCAQMGCDQSAPAYLARLLRCAPAKPSAEKNGSSTGSGHGREAARMASHEGLEITCHEPRLGKGTIFSTSARADPVVAFEGNSPSDPRHTHTVSHRV